MHAHMDRKHALTFRDGEDEKVFATSTGEVTKACAWLTRHARPKRPTVAV